MSKNSYLTAPLATSSLPKGIPYIIGNEAAERFSFYGMKGILTIFMTKYLFLLSDTAGTPMAKAEAIARYHDFTFWVYLTPVLGAFLADWLLGKYRTILSLSIVYCLGHLALALMGSGGLSAENWMLTGLYLIALGSGGIKPCVSAHVGDQFGQSNSHWLTKVFGWFYISINVGAALSTLATPLLLEWYGPHWAFGVPGVLMALATLVFWMGRKVFVHIPARGPDFIKELCGGNTFEQLASAGYNWVVMVIIVCLMMPIFLWISLGLGVVAPGLGTLDISVVAKVCIFVGIALVLNPESRRIIGKLMAIFIFVAVFWALFDQTGSSWVLQAEDLDRNWLGIHWLSSQIQAINPIMIVTLVPLFGYVIYPAIDKVFPLTPLRKISIGLFLMVPGFAIVSVVQSWIDAGQTPTIAWQLFAYAILTASEVMVSITCLEFAYTQAPKNMKSVIMAVFLASVALGNFFTAGVNKFILVEKGDATKVSYTFKRQLAGLDATVRTAFNKSGEVLPRTEKGNELLNQAKDEWDNPIQYRLINRNNFKLTSLGPDKTFMTKDDVVHTVSIARPSTNKDQVEKPLNWRETRLIELLGDKGKAQVERERGGVPTTEFTATLSVGGETKLEGAAYFWFFTWTMLITAILFVFIALWYKPKTYLQEEVSAEA